MHARGERDSRVVVGVLQMCRGPATASVRQMRAVQITEFGGPEVMKVVDLPDPEPQPDTTIVEVAAAGINYADTHQTEDSYLAPQSLPLVPGAEVAGTALTGPYQGQR